MKAFTSREFNQDVSHAKRIARLEPVFVTDRGRPTHVLMSIDAFQRLSGGTETIVDALALSGFSEPPAEAATVARSWPMPPRKR
jgi:hypothetical protein